MPNIFREAKELLDNKDGRVLTEEEQELLSTALIPLHILPQYQDIPIVEGLEELAKMVEDAHAGIN